MGSVSIKTGVAVRKRRTQAERKAETRAILLEVGREHFLRYGLSGASGEKISEEAGFTRGALHANFGDKEGLFEEVVRQSEGARWKRLSMLEDSTLSPMERLRRAQEFFAHMLEDKDYQLSVELQVQALHSAKLRQTFLEEQGERQKHAIRALGKLLEECGIEANCSIEQLVSILSAASYGLALQRRLLGRSLTLSKARETLSALFASLLVNPGAESSQ